MFQANNATGGLGPYFIHERSAFNTIAQNIELGAWAASTIHSSTRNKSLWNLYKNSGNVGTGNFVLDAYNVTGNL